MFTIERRNHWLKTTAALFIPFTPGPKPNIAAGSHAGPKSLMVPPSPLLPSRHGMSSTGACLPCLYEQALQSCRCLPPRGTHCCCRRCVLLECHRTLLRVRLLRPSAAAAARGYLLLPRFAAVAHDRLLRPLADVAVATAVVTAASISSDLPASSSCKP